MNAVQVVDRAIELRDKAKGTETEYDRVSPTTAGGYRWDLCAPNSDSKMQVIVNITFTNLSGKVAHINPICYTVV